MAASVGAPPPDRASPPHTLILRNPRSGGAGAWEEIADRIRAAENVEVVETDSAEEATRRARSAVTDETGVVAAAGGDGTVHSAVAGLEGRDDAPALGILPIGTGNDTGRSLGIPEDPDGALDVLLAGRTRTIDLLDLELDGRREILVNACSGGFSGEVTARITDEIKETWRHLAYARVAVEQMGDPPVYDLALRIDGAEERDFRAYQLVIANGTYMGGGLALVPDARPDDGLLDVAIIRSAPLPRVWTLLPSILRGEEPESELFYRVRGERVELTVDPPVRLSLDGEVTEGRSISARVRRGGLRVVVPADGGAPA